MLIKSAHFTIDQVLGWIRTGRLAIPDFQRDFIWEPDQVAELLDSVARQWPIGSLLLLRDSERRLGSREVASAPRLASERADIYVLDGQQRVTAIYQAVADTSDYCYFVDFNLLESGDGEFIRWERRTAFDNKYPTLQSQAEAQICKIRDIWNDSNFDEWLRHFKESNRRRKLERLRSDRLAGLTSKNYQLVAVELGSDVSLRALARIFETLNRTGTPLDAFDLLVAVLFPSGFNLKNEWEDSKAAYSSFEYFSVDPIEVLKMAALVIRAEFGNKHAPGVRQGDLLSLPSNLLIKTWPQAAELYDQALQFGRINFGWFCKEVIPNPALVLGVGSALLAEVSDVEMRGWYWATAFSQTYSQAANTRVVSDFDRIKSGEIGSLVQPRLNNIVVVLSEPARKNGSALRALGGLLASRGACDPVSGEYLNKLGTVSYRAIGEGRVVERLRDFHGFDQVIFLGKTSDKKLSLAADFDSKTFRAALESQCINLGRGRRDVGTIVEMVRQETYGAW